jgi:hypothetical protein
MENNYIEKKNKSIVPMIILLFALVSASLILIEVGANVSAELLVTTEPVTLEETALPPVSVRPTYPPDYTPAPVMEAQ